MRRALLLVVTLCCAVALEAQPLRILNAPDREWERFQRRHPVLYTWDDCDSKTWIWHGALTWGVGGLIGAVSPLSTRQGRHVMLAVYIARELVGIAFEGNRRWTDIGGDLGFPLIMARVRY